MAGAAFDCHILAQPVSHLLVSEPVESGVVGAGGAVGRGIHANGAAGKAAGYLGAQKVQVNILGNADAVPQPPERCLSRKAGIVRCCPCILCG